MNQFKPGPLSFRYGISPVTSGALLVGVAVMAITKLSGGLPLFDFGPTSAGKSPQAEARTGQLVAKGDEFQVALVQIRLSTDRAMERNRVALDLFERELDRLSIKHDALTEPATGELSSEAASYSNCVALIYYSAWDQVRGGENADKHIQSLIRPKLDSHLNKIKTDVTAAVDRLVWDLRRSAVTLAIDMSTSARTGRDPAFPIDLDGLDEVEIDKALQELGFNGAAIAISVGFDSYAVWQSRILPRLWRMIKAMVVRIFSRQVAIVSSSIAAAAIDGPLPVGDILTVAGLAWTGWDIWASRAEFEHDLKSALGQTVTNAKEGLMLQAIEAARAACRETDKSFGQVGKDALLQLRGN